MAYVSQYLAQNGSSIVFEEVLPAVLQHISNDSLREDPALYQAELLVIMIAVMNPTVTCVVPFCSTAQLPWLS